MNDVTFNSDYSIIARKPAFLLRLSLFALLMILPLMHLHAQKTEEKGRSRWYFGGNIGAQFGQVTLIDVSPLVGYRITDKFSAGIGATYKFYRIRNYNYNTFTSQWQSLNSHIFGGQTFMRYFVMRQFFAHTEYEYLRFRNKVYVLNQLQQRYDRVNVYENVHSVFIGAGYRQLIGLHSAFDIMILYNLNESANSPYENPLIRMGFVIGI